jgi:Tfp pilus assembly protein PilF
MNITAVIVAGTLAASAIAFGIWPSGRTPTRAELAPDPALVRYRYPLTLPDASDEMEATIAALEARMKESPNPFDAADLAEKYCARAQREGDRRDHALSEAYAKRSLELLKTPNAARLTLAKLANARHDFRRAIEIAREHLAVKRSAGAHLIIATAQLALGDPSAAAQAADAAIAIRADTSAHLTRALALEAQGRDAEAAFDFGRAAELEDYGDKSAAARLRTLWGRFLLRRGAYADASTLFEEALRIVPDFTLAVAGQGELALRTGRAAEAIARFEKAFAASRQTRYLIDRARAQELANDRAGANELRAHAEKLVRADVEGHRLELVEILLDRGDARDFAEAAEIAGGELSRRSSFEVRFQLARALSRSGDRDGARAQVAAALALGTKDARLYELAARLEATNPGRAAMYMREADRLDPARTGWRSSGMGAP